MSHIITVYKVAFGHIIIIHVDYTGQLTDLLESSDVPKLSWLLNYIIVLTILWNLRIMGGHIGSRSIVYFGKVVPLSEILQACQTNQ